MRHKLAFIDYWTLTQNYSRGDIVQTYGNISGSLEGFPGIVTAVHPGIGFVDVEFPWGNQRVSPELLVKQNPRFLFNYPSFIDTSYQSWDIDRSHLEDGTDTLYNYARPRRAAFDPVTALAAEYDVRQRRLRAAAAQCEYGGLNSVDAYRAMTSVLESTFGDREIRTAIDHQYKLGLYWSAPGRRYRMNKGELADGLPDCPKCGTNLRKTNYKKHTKLFVCSNCLFCIKPGDIEGLPQPVADVGFGTEEEVALAALKQAKTEIKLAKWDTFKKQVLAWLRRKHPKLKKYHAQVAVDIVGMFAGEADIHKDTIPEREWTKRAETELQEHWWNEVKELVVDMARKRHDLRLPDTAIDDTLEYLGDLKYSSDILKVDKKEITRLLDVARDYEGERTSNRYANSFRALLANISPKPLEVRELMGAGGLQHIHDEVRYGSRSDDIASQFETDFQEYGLGDAMFLLGASTADGLFDRNAYNRLVDILEQVRGEER